MHQKKSSIPANRARVRLAARSRLLRDEHTLETQTTRGDSSTTGPVRRCSAAAALVALLAVALAIVVAPSIDRAERLMRTRSSFITLLLDELSKPSRSLSLPPDKTETSSKKHIARFFSMSVSSPGVDALASLTMTTGTGVSFGCATFRNSARSETIRCGRPNRAYEPTEG